MNLKIKSKLPLIRTIAALLVLLTVMGVVTYSWTMGIEELSINTGLKTASIPSSVNDVINLDGTKDQEIDLTDFDQLSDDGMYFSEVTSTDGVNFKIPNGGNTPPRDANTNDVGEKFIKFDFCVMPVDKCSLRFAEIPTFTVTNSHGAIVTDADTSGFRIMIGEVEGNTEEIITSKIFTTGVDTNGAKQLSTFGTNQDILSFDDQYYPSQHYLIISVWLDGNYTDSTDNLAGNKVKLNLKLKAYSENKKTTIYFEERSGYSSYYAWVYNSSTNVKYLNNQVWPGDKATYNTDNACYEYSFVTSDEGNFYVFVSDNGNTSTQYPLNGDTANYLQGVIGGTYLFTADNKLVEVKANQLVASIRVGVGSGRVGFNEQTSNSIVTSYGTPLHIQQEPADGYEFVGLYSNKECTDDCLKATAAELARFTFKPVTGNQIIYAKFVEAPKYTVTFKAVTYNSAGTLYSGEGDGYFVWYDDAGAIAGGGYTRTETLSLNETYSVKAYLNKYENNPSDCPYKFVGWYSDEACTNLVTDQLDLTVYATKNADYYAKFVEKTKTFYCTDSQGWGQLYCYYWGGTSGPSSFPGYSMTYDHTNTYNQNVYRITIPITTTYIIIANKEGNVQTINIPTSRLTDNGYYYIHNNGSYDITTW